MNKLMTVVAASVCAVSLSGSAVAAEDVSADKKVTTAEAEALEGKNVLVLLRYGADFEREMMDLSVNIPLEQALDLG